MENKIENKIDNKLDNNTELNIDNLETGDMILFNGNYFLSKIIEYFTNSLYSHVAVVIKNPNFNNKQLQGIYILESGSENSKDPENYRHKFGVQLTKLEEKLADYNGQLYIRKLECIRDQSFYNKIIQIHSDVHNLPYDLNPIDWFKAKFRLNIGNTHKRNTYWCSALVCYFYVKLGFLEQTIPWTLASPNDLSSNSHSDLINFENCIMHNDKKLKIN